MEMRVADLLRIYLEQRKNKNSQYSMRSFARNLKISSGKLSEIISGKVSIGPRLYKKIVQNLGLTDLEELHFKKIYDREHRSRKLTGNFKRHLKESEYALISQPEHFEILSLMDTDNFQCNISWIQKRLGYSSDRIRKALRILLDLNLIEMTSANTYQLVQGGVTTTHDVPSAIIRQSHEKVILSSLSSLERDSVTERDFSSITMAVDPARLEDAKQMIRDFRRRLCRLMEHGEKTEVYTLNVQLFPNTVLSKKK